MTRSIVCFASILAVAACAPGENDEAAEAAEETAVAEEATAGEGAASEAMADAADRPDSEATVCGRDVQVEYRGYYVEDVDEPVDPSWSADDRIRLRDTLESALTGACDAGDVDAADLAEVESFTFIEAESANIVSIYTSSEHDLADRFLSVDIPPMDLASDDLPNGMQTATLCRFNPDHPSLGDGTACLPD